MWVLGYHWDEWSYHSFVDLRDCEWCWSSSSWLCCMECLDWQVSWNWWYGRWRLQALCLCRTGQCLGNSFSERNYVCKFETVHSSQRIVVCLLLTITLFLFSSSTHTHHHFSTHNSFNSQQPHFILLSLKLCYLHRQLFYLLLQCQVFVLQLNGIFTHHTPHT